MRKRHSRRAPKQEPPALGSFVWRIQRENSGQHTSNGYIVTLVIPQRVDTDRRFTRLGARECCDLLSLEKT